MLTEDERRDSPIIVAAVRLLTDAGVLRWQRSTIIVAKDRKVWEAKLRLDLSPQQDTDTGYMLTIGPEPPIEDDDDDGAPLWCEYEGDDVVALAAYLETMTDDERALHRMGFRESDS